MKVTLNWLFFCSSIKQYAEPVKNGLINELKLTVALIWELQSYLDANDCFHTISFEFGSFFR